MHRIDVANTENMYIFDIAKHAKHAKLFSACSGLCVQISVQAIGLSSAKFQQIASIYLDRLIIYLLHLLLIILILNPQY